MKKMKLQYVVLFIIIAAITAAADRLIKIFALDYLAEDKYTLIPGFLNLELARNTGIAFSIGLPMIIQMMIFPVLFIIGIYLIYTYYDFSKKTVQIIAGAVAGGAIGNFIDRAYFGHVVDYISVVWFPVFNLADIFIVIGIFLLFVFYGKIKRA